MSEQSGFEKRCLSPAVRKGTLSLLPFLRHLDGGGGKWQAGNGSVCVVMEGGSALCVFSVSIQRVSKWASIFVVKSTTRYQANFNAQTGVFSSWI